MDSDDRGCLGCIGLIVLAAAIGSLTQVGYGWLVFGSLLFLWAMFNR